MDGELVTTMKLLILRPRFAREQTADIVHQVETQFKNLKQTQRDLFDGTLPIPEKDRVETTGMNAEDLESLSKSKLRAAQLKQQNVSFKMRLFRVSVAVIPSRHDHL